MMTPMAATTGRLLALAVAFLLIAAACSDADDDIGAELDAAATSSTTTTPPSTTTTTEPTTTTLSDLELAEAEIRDVVTEWYQFPVDYALGEAGLRLEQTTGILRQRILESAAQLDAEGQILRALDVSPIEITAVRVSLEKGTAEVDACTASADGLLDAETLEVIAADNPNDASTSVFQLQLIDGQWKINEWISSALDGDPIDCEVQA